MTLMLDLDLLRSFVSVVEAGGFTRAGERVHRTQSTVSQQIKRLEDDLGQILLHRNGKDVTPTEAGERLLSYARRLLALAEEARDVVARKSPEGAVKLGIPEDFAAYRLAQLLAAFSRAHPNLRLDVRAYQSLDLKRDLDRGDIDLALLKRSAGEGGAIAAWPERVYWVTSRQHPVDIDSSSLPLIGFPARLPVSGTRDPRSGERRPRLVHVLHILKPGRHPGGDRGRPRTRYPRRHGDPGRSSRADRSRRLRPDRAHRTRFGRLAGREPDDAQAGRAVGGVLREGARQGGVAATVC